MSFPTRETAHKILQAAGYKTYNSAYVVCGYGRPVDLEQARQCFPKHPTYTVYKSIGEIVVTVKA